MDSPAGPAPAAAAATLPASSGLAKNKLSCTACRLRKVRCDRVHPCSPCTRSGVDCVFPTRKRMERPRKSKNSELLNRISRLESIVSKVDLEALNNFDMPERGSQPGAATPQPQPITASFSQETQPLPTAPQISQTETGREAYRPSEYMSGEFWGNLCDEVEGLKQALGQSTDSDSEEEPESLSPEAQSQQVRLQFSTQGLLGGVPSPPESTCQLTHPNTHRMKYLLTTFFERVDPIIKILHRPTLMKIICTGFSEITPAQEALIFSMYFGAISSFAPTASIFQNGEDQMTMFKNAQLDVERALAAADYLNNNDLECLQALTLYVACLRVHNDTRASWVLTAVILRLAQAHNINRDGDGSHYSPYVAEMRRRLWWQVIVLDIRAAEDRGTEAMIPSDSYSTRFPLNINDDDFGPESPGPLVERTGPSDVTFSLCTAHSSRIFLWVGHAQARDANSYSVQSEEEIIAMAQALESKFMVNADPSHFQSYLASRLVRLINLKLWLLMQFPIHPPTSNKNPRWPKVPHETILRTTVSVMELCHISHQEDSERFNWWGKTYSQWHPLAVALAELCTQTRGPLVEQAWRIIEVVYPIWGRHVADSKKGALWRPIRKLYKKAKSARTASLRAELEATEALRRLDLIVGGALTPFGGMPALVGVDPGQDAGNSGSSNNTYLSSVTSSVTPASDFNRGDEQLSLGRQLLQQPEFFHDPIASATGWPEVDFGMPLDTGKVVDAMNWPTSDVWNEFLVDTFDTGSGTGSSESNFP